MDPWNTYTSTDGIADGIWWKWVVAAGEPIAIAAPGASVHCNPIPKKTGPDIEVPTKGSKPYSTQMTPREVESHEVQCSSAVLEQVMRRCLDLHTLANAAGVCRLWAETACRPGVWRMVFHRHFPPPGVSPEEAVEVAEGGDEICARSHRDWRRSYKTRLKIAKRRNGGGSVSMPAAQQPHPRKGAPTWGELNVQHQATFTPFYDPSREAHLLQMRR